MMLPAAERPTMSDLLSFLCGSCVELHFGRLRGIGSLISGINELFHDCVAFMVAI
jgi:hypothetical protein